jgi:hypothetical protein
MSTIDWICCPQCQLCSYFTSEYNTQFGCNAPTSAAVFYRVSGFADTRGRTYPTCESFKPRQQTGNGSSDSGGRSNGGRSGGGIGGFLKREIDSQMAANKAVARNLADATGLGLVADTVGGIGKIARFAKDASDKDAARRAEIERQKQEKKDALQPFVDEKHQEVDSIIIDGDETVLLGGIGGLFGIMTSIKIMCEEKDDNGETSLSCDDKWGVFKPVHQAALSKFDEAVEKLQEQSSTGKIIGEFIDTVIISKRPEELQKEAGKKLMEKQKAKGLRSVEEIQITRDAVSCTEAIVKLFDIIDMYKKHITAENVVDKKDRNLILGPVCMAAITKIDSALEKLHGLGSEDNRIASLFEEVLELEKNLKFSGTTGKFHDKNNMPLLANVGDTFSKLNPFARKDKPADNAGSGSTPNADSADNPEESKKNKMDGANGGLFGFFKKK